MFQKLLRNEYGYNLRERLNIYASAIIGALVPIVGLGFILNQAGIENQAFCYGSSLLLNLIPFGGCPIALRGTAGGLMVGMKEASRLQDKRLQKKAKNLEQTVVNQTGAIGG